MIWNTKLVSAATIFAVTCAVSAATFCYRKRKSEIDEVLVFCKLKFNIFNCFDRIFSYLTSAKRSVDICMPGIHNQMIIGCLLKTVKKRSTKARIIIDKNSYDETYVAFINELKEAGAEIKYKDSDLSTQHKFCVIDYEILMTGTLNWGDDLSADDWNYVLITSKKHLVDPVKREFEKLWLSCKNYL